MAFLIISIIIHVQIFKSKAWFIMVAAHASLMAVVVCMLRLHASLHPKEQQAYIIYMTISGIVGALLAVLIIMTFTRIIWLVTPNDKRTFKELGVPPRAMSLFWGGLLIITDMIKIIAQTMGKPKDPHAKPDPKSSFARTQTIAIILQFFVVVGFTIWTLSFMMRSRRWILHPEVHNRNWRTLGWSCVAMSLLATWKKMWAIVENDSMMNPMAYTSQHEWTYWVNAQLPAFREFEST